MAITDESRFQLHERLQAVLGREEATTLMEHLPPVGWADVATKHDLDQQSILTKRDLDHQAAATKAQLDHHSADTTRRLDAFQAEWKRDLTDFRTEWKRDLEAGLGAVRTELRVGLERQAAATEQLGLQLRGETQAMMNRLLLQLLAAMLAFVSVVLLVAGLG